MKKIIAIILAITCAFALFSCGDDEIEASVASVNEMYENSAPTKAYITTVKAVDGVEYNGEYTLVTGKVGGAIATQYTYSYEVLRPVDEGAGSNILDAKKVISGSKEFLDGKGVRVNGGSWNPDGYNFAPTSGAIAINITMSNIKDPVYADNTLTFKVAPEKAQEVFGTALDNNLEEGAISGDIEVSVTNAGSVITGVVITYSVEGEDDYPDSVITITAEYSYDLQKITMK